MELTRALAEPLLVRRDREPDARVAYQVPADEPAVAAVVRIAERPLQRVVQHQVEERGGSRRRETGHRVLFQRGEQLVLVGLGQLREAAAFGGASMRIEMDCGLYIEYIVAPTCPECASPKKCPASCVRMLCRS